MNIQKYTRSQVATLIAHDDRSERKEHSNESIDSSRSHLNYNLIEGEPLENYHSRMSEVFCLNRKNVNTIGALVITKPAEVKNEDEQKFFKKCVEYYQREFGEKNVISAFVHKDEKTPHVHIKFIPVYEQTKEIKRGKDAGKVITRESVSFDEVCPRSWYRKNHRHFNKWIDQELGYHIGILNGKTIKGAKDVNELKVLEELKQQYDEDLKDIKAHISSIRSISDDLRKKPAVKPTDKKKYTFTGSKTLKTLSEQEWNEVETQISDLKTTNKALSDELKQVNQVVLQQQQLHHALMSQDVRKELEETKAELERRSKFIEVIEKFMDMFKLKELFTRFFELFKQEKKI